jgi:Bacterial regulatory helix-turn-helix protein, lysR family
MLDLNDFLYFVQVVERRGFTPAGRALGMPKSTLSYRMKKLEAELGVRLLNRTSRHFAPPQAGEEDTSGPETLPVSIPMESQHDARVATPTTGQDAATPKRSNPGPDAANGQQ